MWVVSEQLVKDLADFLRGGICFLGLGELDHFDGSLAERVFEAYINQIEAEHVQEGIKQGMNNLGGLSAAPDGGKGQDADQIIDAALEALDFNAGILELQVHKRTSLNVKLSFRFAALEARGGIPGRGGTKKRIQLEHSPDDDHGVGAHDVDHGVSAEFCKIVDADDRIIVTEPDIVHAGFKFDEIVDVRSVFSGPVHVADDAAERKVSLGVAAGQLFERLEHAVLIEAAVAQVGFGVGAKFKLTALLRGGRVDAFGGQSLEMVVVLIGVNDVDCFVAAGETILNKRK